MSVTKGQSPEVRFMNPTPDTSERSNAPSSREGGKAGAFCPQIRIPSAGNPIGHASPPGSLCGLTAPRVTQNRTPVLKKNTAWHITTHINAKRIPGAMAFPDAVFPHRAASRRTIRRLSGYTGFHFRKLPQRNHDDCGIIQGITGAVLGIREADGIPGFQGNRKGFFHLTGSSRAIRSHRPTPDVHG